MTSLKIIPKFELYSDYHSTAVSIGESFFRTGRRDAFIETIASLGSVGINLQGIITATPLPGLVKNGASRMGMAEIPIMRMSTAERANFLVRLSERVLPLMVETSPVGLMNRIISAMLAPNPKELQNNLGSERVVVIGVPYFPSSDPENNAGKTLDMFEAYDLLRRSPQATDLRFSQTIKHHPELHIEVGKCGDEILAIAFPYGQKGAEHFAGRVVELAR